MNQLPPQLKVRFGVGTRIGYTGKTGPQSERHSSNKSNALIGNNILNIEIFDDIYVSVSVPQHFITRDYRGR